MTETKKVAKNTDKILMSADHSIGITTFDNLAQPEDFYEKMALRKFIDWNERRNEFWIENAHYYCFFKFCQLFGFETSDFIVYVPKEEHPIVFRKGEMCLLIAPTVTIHEKEEKSGGGAAIA